MQSWNTEQRRRIGVGAAALVSTVVSVASPASAHIIYTTSFESGQASVGALRGQDFWTNSANNRFQVTNAMSGFGAQSISYASNAGGPTSAMRPTLHIQLDPIPGMVMLQLYALVRVENLRPDTQTNLTLWAAQEVTGNVLRTGIQNGAMFSSSGLGAQPHITGPAFTPGVWHEVMVQLDMITGHGQGMIDGQVYGEFDLPITEFQNLELATGIGLQASFFNAAGAGPEVMYIDTVTIRHPPAPGTAVGLLGGLVIAGRRRRGI